MCVPAFLLFKEWILKISLMPSCFALGAWFHGIKSLKLLDVEGIGELVLLFISGKLSHLVHILANDGFVYSPPLPITPSVGDYMGTGIEVTEAA